MNCLTLSGSTSAISRRQPQATSARGRSSDRAGEGEIMCFLGRGDILYYYPHSDEHLMQPVTILLSWSTVSGLVQGW